jgi:hypothetical protein
LNIANWSELKVTCPACREAEAEEILARHLAGVEEFALGPVAHDLEPAASPLMTMAEARFQSRPEKLSSTLARAALVHAVETPRHHVRAQRSGSRSMKACL